MKTQGNRGKQRKTGSIGKQTKTQENRRKNGKIGENVGKQGNSQENKRKQWKTQENMAKHGKHTKTGED